MKRLILILACVLLFGCQPQSHHRNKVTYTPQDDSFMWIMLLQQQQAMQYPVTPSRSYSPSRTLSEEEEETVAPKATEEVPQEIVVEEPVPGSGEEATITTETDTSESGSATTSESGGESVSSDSVSSDSASSDGGGGGDGGSGGDGGGGGGD